MLYFFYTPGIPFIHELEINDIDGTGYLSQFLITLIDCFLCLLI